MSELHETNKPRQSTTSAGHKAGRLLLAAGVLAGVGGASAYEATDVPTGTTTQQYAKDVLKPAMTSLDEQLVAHQKQDPARFHLTNVGETPNGMYAVKITDAQAKTFGVMGTKKDGEVDPGKPLYFSSEGTLADGYSTRHEVKMVAQGGEKWAQDDGYNTTGWQAQETLGESALDTASPPTEKRYIETMKDIGLPDPRSANPPYQPENVSNVDKIASDLSEYPPEL